MCSLSADEIQSAVWQRCRRSSLAAHSKWLRRYAHFVTSADTGAVLGLTEACKHVILNGMY